MPEDSSVVELGVTASWRLSEVEKEDLLPFVEPAFYPHRTALVACPVIRYRAGP
jgi:hypothetical protein